MAKFRIEVDAPKPVEVKVHSIAELDAAVAKVVRALKLRWCPRYRWTMPQRKCSRTLLGKLALVDSAAHIPFVTINIHAFHEKKCTVSLSR
jgi:hypothetical protein